MGKIGKPERAPGYERVARERQEWEDTKAAYLRDPGFEDVLMDKYYRWTDHIHHFFKYQDKWNDKLRKLTKVWLGPEERLAARICDVGNNVEHDIEQRNDVIEAYGFDLEARVAMQDILRKKVKEFCWHLYKLEKEKEDRMREQGEMGCEEEREPGKRVMFA